MNGHQVKGALDDDHRVKLAGDPVKIEKDFRLYEARRQQPLRIVRRDLFHRPARVADQFSVPTMDRKDNPIFHQALTAKAQAEELNRFRSNAALRKKRMIHGKSSELKSQLLVFRLLSRSGSRNRSGLRRRRRSFGRGSGRLSLTASAAAGFARALQSGGCTIRQS